MPARTWLASSGHATDVSAAERGRPLLESVGRWALPTHLRTYWGYTTARNRLDVTRGGGPLVEGTPTRTRRRTRAGPGGA